MSFSHSRALPAPLPDFLLQLLEALAPLTPFLLKVDTFSVMDVKLMPACIPAMGRVLGPCVITLSIYAEDLPMVQAEWAKLLTNFPGLILVTLRGFVGPNGLQSLISLGACAAVRTTIIMPFKGVKLSEEQVAVLGIWPQVIGN